MESNELVNFLEPKFGPSVKCSCIMDDLYTVDNLISADRQKNQLGFMAYRVVKPPIELHFSLKCRIELCAIKMWTQIDSLKSTGFEVHVNGDDASREYHKIGSFFNLKENSLQFVNTQYSSPGYECDSSVTCAQLYPSTRIHTRKVKNIKICIKQSNRSCVPVLKRIEVWGKVSIFERNEQHQEILRLIAEADATEAVQMYGCPSTNENTSPIQTIDDSTESSQMDVPETFLDEITYEIMALPMILPSGKVIDNTSLMKHNKEEERWGRLPSDPFTGQIFTDKRKPILDVRLKSQIDTFLLKNCDRSDVGSVPRTVGTLKKRKNDQVTATDINGQDSNEGTLHANSLTMSKRALLANVNEEATCSQASSSYTIPNGLDSKVQNILRTRKYTKLNKDNEETLCLNNCYQCQTKHEKHSNSLYIIRLCSHLICRNCLVDGNVKLCKCGREFSNFHIRKYHITREI